MSAAHTAGPWSWHGVELLSATSFVLESTPNGRPSPYNARLIAAAPDLRDELTMLCNVLDGCGIDLPPEVEARVSFARAAIAKATGGQP